MNFFGVNGIKKIWFTCLKIEIFFAYFKNQSENLKLTWNLCQKYLLVSKLKNNDLNWIWTFLWKNVKIKNQIHFKI